MILAFTFLVEDGTGLAASNSYLSEADFNDHHDGRGADYSAYNSAAIEVALVQATDFIDKRFGRRFRGDLIGSTQALEWPRLDAYSDDDFALTGVPAALEKGTAEYALLALQLGQNLAPLPAPDFGILDPATGEVTNNSSGRVIERTEKVGPIEESTKFASPDTVQPTGNLSQYVPDYPQADMWIEELIEHGISRRLERG